MVHCGMLSGYDQFCPIAKASEILATRWTPLILRELMADVHSFNDIHRGVPLISRAVLVARLRDLEHHGIVERRKRDCGPGYGYWLTPAGNAFRAVVSELGHWGLIHARDVKSTDLDPSYLVWAFRKRARLDALPDHRVVVRFEFSGVPANHMKFRTLWLILREVRRGCMRERPRLRSRSHCQRKDRRFDQGLSRPRPVARSGGDNGEDRR